MNDYYFVLSLYIFLDVYNKMKLIVNNLYIDKRITENEISYFKANYNILDNEQK